MTVEICFHGVWRISSEGFGKAFFAQGKVKYFPIKKGFQGETQNPINLFLNNVFLERKQEEIQGWKYWYDVVERINF